MLVKQENRTGPDSSENKVRKHFLPIEKQDFLFRLLSIDLFSHEI